MFRPAPLPHGAPRPPARGLWWQPVLLGSLLLMNSGCQASDQSPLQWPVAPPPALRSEDPVLWVALAARLGPATPGAGQAAPLVLRPASGQITLQDGAGQTLTAPELILHWGWTPLPQPFSVRRRVLGPFASYESAEAAARPWAAAGHQPVIARPADWEVWAPADAPDPPGRPAVRSTSFAGRPGGSGAS
ncbi:MAG: hypothetical protein ACO3ZD_09175, partial [Cyanobium sp.]